MSMKQHSQHGPHIVMVEFLTSMCDYLRKNCRRESVQSLLSNMTHTDTLLCSMFLHQMQLKKIIKKIQLSAHPEKPKDAMSTKPTSCSWHADVSYVREKLGISSACTDWQVCPGESYRLRIERRPLIEPER